MRGKVLIADDERAFAEGCRRILAQEGYEAEVALTGPDALARIEQVPFDVVLLDLRLGDFDGVAILEQLRARGRDTDVVIITGYASVETATRALRFGARDYLEKPVDPERLGTLLETIMKRRAAELAEPVPIQEVRMRVEGFDSKPSPAVAEAVSRDVGVSKTRLGIYQLTVLGFFAGAYIAFGAALATLAGHDLPGHFGLGFARLVSGAAFSVGLMLVVISGAELFTGNNLMLISALDRRIAWSSLMQKWTIVYVANFVGALALVGIMYGSGLWRMGADFAVARSALDIANAKVNLTFLEALLRGIACNWLVCLAVWMAMAARQVACKILAIFFPIMAFVALGFEHSVANMYFVPFGIVLKGTQAATAYGKSLAGLTWPRFVLANLVPVTIGNVIGGAGLVAVLYWSVYLRKPRAAGQAPGPA
jgi:formate/nitrite transporter